jgi:hypothetical protein
VLIFPDTYVRKWVSLVCSLYLAELTSPKISGCHDIAEKLLNMMINNNKVVISK